MFLTSTHHEHRLQHQVVAQVPNPIEKAHLVGERPEEDRRHGVRSRISRQTQRSGVESDRVDVHVGRPQPVRQPERTLRKGSVQDEQVELPAQDVQRFLVLEGGVTQLPRVPERVPHREGPLTAHPRPDQVPVGVVANVLDQPGRGDLLETFEGKVRREGTHEGDVVAPWLWEKKMGDVS